MEQKKIVRICPECGQSYDGVPALSREDNKTEICPDCGVRQSLKVFGLSADKTEEIIVEIHRLTER